MGAAWSQASFGRNRFVILDRHKREIVVKNLNNKTTKQVPSPVPGVDCLYDGVASGCDLHDDDQQRGRQALAVNLNIAVNIHLLVSLITDTTFVTSLFVSNYACVPLTESMPVAGIATRPYFIRLKYFWLDML